jgi:hypothetical protein
MNMQLEIQRYEILDAWLDGLFYRAYWPSVGLFWGIGQGKMA